MRTSEGGRYKGKARIADSPGHDLSCPYRMGGRGKLEDRAEEERKAA
ncbi:MAG TPA: hypothetical protein VNH19_17250 [Candidatus Limnocylindrales bacterium]|nr:hypothetical protein [Candidatus Limnocylindrales bacterium]